MTDREKVIKGLADISEYARAKADIAGIGKGKEVFDSYYRAAEDAIALLREQEPVQFKVTRQDKSYPFWDSVCTGCGYKTSTVKDYWKYCPVCGRAVKWDE